MIVEHFEILLLVSGQAKVKRHDFDLPAVEQNVCSKQKIRHEIHASQMSNH